MLLFLYNILQLTIICLFWPVLLAVVLMKGKYRRRLPARLGFGLTRRFPSSDRGKPTIWIHGLSVGEITSAAPLAAGLRRKYPDCRITVTTATETGEAIARTLLGNVADHIFASPLDILPAVRRFVGLIKPDLFILVETDFWPNLLTTLSEQGIPTILVNGRISQKAFKAYRKFSFFFMPMFRSLSCICLQTETEKEKMRRLGIDEGKLYTFGNLKYDTPTRNESPPSEISQLLPAGRMLLVAGSTHAGEEELIFKAYREARKGCPELYLVLVPRKPERADEILQLGRSLLLNGRKRTEPPDTPGDYLLVNTIGELVELYSHCQLAIIGGSWVPTGGHNPVEAAVMSVPVLFGPHMEDFEEIAADLLAAGGAMSIADGDHLASALSELAMDGPLRQRLGRRAGRFVSSQQGVVSRHLELLDSLL